MFRRGKNTMNCYHSDSHTPTAHKEHNVAYYYYYFRTPTGNSPFIQDKAKTSNNAKFLCFLRKEYLILWLVLVVLGIPWWSDAVVGSHLSLINMRWGEIIRISTVPLVSSILPVMVVMLWMMKGTFRSKDVERSCCALIPGICWAPDRVAQRAVWGCRRLASLTSFVILPRPGLRCQCCCARHPTCRLSV